jgi:transcriptional regulator with XRE-family HTH domain
VVGPLRAGDAAVSADRPSPAVAAMLEGDAELQREWERTAPERAVAAVLVGVRRDRGLSQGELARAAGWDQAFVSRLESGRAGMPTLETIARYARVCGGRARLELCFDSGASAAVDLDAFAPEVEPTASALAPLRRRRERRLAGAAVPDRAGEGAPDDDVTMRLPVESERRGDERPPPRGLPTAG